MKRKMKHNLDGSYYMKHSRYKPHQGKREKARRKLTLAKSQKAEEACIV